VEAEREPLIPSSPKIVLPRISLGKWFWIGLITLVVAIALTLVSVAAVGPAGYRFPISSNLGILEALGGVNALSFAYSTMRTFLSTGAVDIAAVILLWVACARPGMPDRVLFVPAVTLSAGILSSTIASAFLSVTGNLVLSPTIAVDLVGCASIALAARGVGPRLRIFIWILCVLSVVQEPIVGYVMGLTPAVLAASLLIGMSVLAFGFECAEQAGAELFLFDAADAAERPTVVAGQAVAGLVAAGILGVVAYVAIGCATLYHWVDISHGQYFESGLFGPMITDLTGWPLAANVASSLLGGVGFWSIVAAVALWVAFANPGVANRLIFLAGVILGTIAAYPDVSGAFDVLGWKRISIVGYPSSEVAYAFAGVAALYAISRTLRPDWRRIISASCIAVAAIVVVGQLLPGIPLVYVLGGAVLGVSCFVFGLAIARRAGVDIFAAQKPYAEG
jgi:hypothetical protein